MRKPRVGVTGCSYAGKMALYSGAFDERIALTIAQESGGGGAPAWRVSHNIEPNGSVKKIDNTDYRWFRDSMMQFSGDNVYKLPHDHHELMAMVAPRALLVTGEPILPGCLTRQTMWPRGRRRKYITRLALPTGLAFISTAPMGTVPYLQARCRQCRPL